MSCWPLVSNNMAAAAGGIFSNLSGKLAKYVCGVSSPTTTSPDDDDDDRQSHKKAELRSPLLLSPDAPPGHGDVDVDGGVDTPAYLPPDVVSSAEHGGGGHEEETSSSSSAAAAAVALPCLAFPSEHGYRIFSLAHMRVLGGADGVRPMPPVPGRRLVPSPHGGTVLATDVCYRHPCHLVDPFTGARSAPLPDLPIPFSEKEPVQCFRDEPRRAPARATDDGLAWDWSPRGVIVARGDTAFFCEHGGGGGGGGRWSPVHQSRLGSPMTVNHSAGRFFLLELRTLETTVIDAGTLRAGARIPAPPLGAGDVVDGAYLAPSADDAILLVRRRRAGDSSRDDALFTEAYRARHRGRSRSRRPPRWRPVVDIGDRAVFVDGAHAFTFTVTAGAAAGATANRVYAILAQQVTHPCGRVAVAYDVGIFDLVRPERSERMKLNAGEVERMWGQPHWIIPYLGISDRHEGFHH